MVVKSYLTIIGLRSVIHIDISRILKYNNYSKEIWLKYSGLISYTATASKKWDAIKNNTQMNIHGLQNIAKEINKEGY